MQKLNVSITGNPLPLFGLIGSINANNYGVGVVGQSRIYCTISRTNAVQLGTRLSSAKSIIHFFIPTGDTSSYAMVTLPLCPAFSGDGVYVFGLVDSLICRREDVTRKILVAQ